MTAFEYAAIFIGIVVGLALQNTLSSIHKLVEAGSRVRWHWMAPAAAFGAIVLTLGNFWFWWLTRDLPLSLSHNFLMFLASAMALSLLFLACAATLPDEVPAEGVDLKDYYFDNRHRMWGYSAAYYVVSLCIWMAVVIRRGFESPTLHADLVFVAANAAAVAMSVTLIVVRNRWLHAAWLVGGTLFLLFLYGPMPV